jgi:GNAT superfamily N-acetyltransferase
MPSTFEITLEPEPKPGDMKVIMAGLLNFNSLKTGGATLEHLLITVLDLEKTVIGGLIGCTYLGWLQVHALWLPDELRGQGYGCALLAAAEEEARRRGCTKATLETYSFQALTFYENRGYVVFGTLPDMPPGGAKYFLAKSLTEENRDE